MKKENKKINTFGQFLLELKDIYRPFFGAVVVVLILILLQQAIALIGPYIYGKVIDGIVQGREIKEVISLCLLSLVIFLINDGLIKYYEDKTEVQKIDFDVSRAVNQKTMDKLFAFSIGQHENQNSGVKKSIIDRGQKSLTELASMFVYQVFPMVLQIIVTIIALFILAPILGAVVFVGVSIYVFISIYSTKVFGKRLRDLQDMYVESDKKQSEFLRNVSLVKLNAKEKDVSKEHDESVEAANKEAKSIWLRFIRFFQLRSIVSNITRIAVLMVGVYLVYQKMYTPGFLVVFLSWSSGAFERIYMLGFLQRRTMELYAAIKNYFILLNVEPNIKEIDNPIILEKIKGKIEYKNIYFKYPAREEIIKDGEEIAIVKDKKRKEEDETLKKVNIIIEPGQRVAVVGHSGAGKSTLVQLLTRAYDPDKGKVLIDDYDLKDLSLKGYRKSLGIVPQEVSLFDNTLRYNILFGADKSVTEKELEQAIKMSRVDGFLKNMENGLDTLIGERGVKLSGGERQRVGIARALVKNPAILIFDEATSSLDVENEAIIRESIEKASKGRTTIIIAHRLSTIKDADKIIVLEKGRIIGEGKHKDLLKNCEAYNKMIKIQTVIVG
ncbi:MAG: ABC transporter ATP-binding protein [Candidatus Paceibacterota bacterium]|jgi:ATP-binding cassette subfamily B protein